MNKILTIIFVVSINIFSQWGEKPKDDLRNFFTVGSDILKSPSNFDSNDWIKFGSVWGITTASSFIDLEIKKYSQENKTDFLNSLMKIDDLYHIEFMGGLTVILYGYANVAKDNKLRNLGLKLFESTIYSGLINAVMKVTIGRKRPNIADDNFVFNPFSFDFNNTAFPSGHTTLAFAYSTVMANEINNLVWKIFWYSAATLVGAARIYNNVHWFSDTLMGGAIGYFIGDFVSRHKTNQPPNPAPPAFFVTIPLN